MEKQQTAVEWLIEQLYNHSGHIDLLDVANLNGYFEQAKQMERENQKYCWGKAVESVQSTSLPEFDSFEDYYTQTYGQ